MLGRSALHILIILGTAAGLRTAMAQTEVENNCGDVNPDISIAACTLIIETGQLGPVLLANTFTSRGFAYAQKGNNRRAVQDYDIAIKLHPDHAIAHNNRCYALALLRKLEQALADCEKAVTLQPNTASILDSRGYVYLQLHRYTDAIKDYDAALRISPKLSESLYGRGVAYKKLGKKAAAARDFAAAKAIDPRTKIVLPGALADAASRP